MRNIGFLAAVVGLAPSVLGERPAVKWSPPKPPSFYDSHSGPGGYGGYGGHPHHPSSSPTGTPGPADSLCLEDTDPVPTVAPLQNIFAGLTDKEAADVTAFLHRQKSLNLTANANATDWDNVIVIVEVLPPNKTQALPFLDGEGRAPPRYAKATIQFQATLEPYIQEYAVGPLPVSRRTTVKELNWPYNKGKGRGRVYNAGSSDLTLFLGNVSQSIVDITLDLWNRTYLNLENDTLSLLSIDPLEISDDGRVTSWNEFMSTPSNLFGTGSILQLGLHFRVDLTGRDPSKWAVTGWYYGGIFYKSTAEFRKAYYSPGFKKIPANFDNELYWTDPKGPKPALDSEAPPQLIAPQGPRYFVDEEKKYVEWMDFSFYIAFRRDTGLRLYDVRFKGERIIYELGMEEAAAHYAGFGPSESYTAFMDTYYGFGPTAFELVQGYDCPSHATYLNTSSYWRERSVTHKKSMCMFEMDPGYPMSRHSSANYVSVTKNVFFTLRSISTLGNYDYMFDYNFYRDGAIEVSVRASGYIDAAHYANNTEYGFRINDYLSGSMHDHVLNYRLDLDIKGTANSLQKLEFIPTTEVYPWSDGQERNTMKLVKSYIESEDDSKINWAPNAAASYAVVNKDAPNKNGEYPGYRIAPATASTVHLTVVNSSDLKNTGHWATHQLFAVQHHDTEPRSVYAYNSIDSANPLVDFSKFFDGESLDQEDLVIYFNLGMHHAPDTQDLPNTVFTNAHSSVMISPQNYNLQNPSRQTVHQVRVNYENGHGTGIVTFNGTEPKCLYNLTSTIPDLSDYTGDIVIRKFPYDPSDPYYEDSAETPELIKGP